MADGQATFKIQIEVDPGDIRGTVNRTLDDIKGSTTGLDNEINKIQKSLGGAADQQKAFQQSLSTTRYALYDVSSTLGATGLLLTGLAVATTAVAVAWERDFAQVARTSGATGEALGVLREELVKLTQTMPISFGDLTRIATLAGQLNVPAERIAAFTETVAKTVAVTDLSVDAAATAFGRLDALLPDVQGNYEALGSSIAKVGVNSVATESQIVNISTQISSMGNFAGLTAAEVVGLSGALASVGAAPELSRGTITRVFTQMQKAISTGGDSLERFATIAGVSGDEFASAFGTNRFGPIFQKFIEGLNDTARTGGDATKALADLGITSVRDVPLLLRLAGAGQILGQSFTDARDGFADGTELTKQYGVIAETTAARIQILVNNFQAFLDAIGSQTTGPLRSVVDLLSQFFQTLTDVANDPFWGTFLSIGTVLAGLVGVLTVAAGALALFGASSIGVQQALQGLSVAAPGAVNALLGTGTAATIASGEMKGAAISAKVLGAALKAITLVGAILILPDVIGAIGRAIADVKFEAQGLEKNTSAAFDRLLKGAGELAEKLGSTEFTASSMRALSGLSSDTLLQDLKAVDEALAESANSGNIQTVREQYNELREAWVKGGGDAQLFRFAMTDTNAALEASKGPVADGKTTFESLDDAMNSVEQQAQATEQAINELRDAVLNFGQTGINAEQASINMQRALNDMAAAAADGEASVDGTNAASLTLRQSFLDVDKAARDAALAMIENGSTAEEATASYMAQRQAIIDSITAKTGDAEAAAAWADAVLGNASEAQTAIQQYSAEVNRVPETKTTRFFVDATGAYREVDSLVNYINSRSATMTITERIVYESAVQSRGGRLVPGAATGGEIRGPGTGTSDSIVARLSNGEFVMKAAAVNKYGTAFMHAVNSGKVPKFANGGSVTPSSPSLSAGIMTGVVELGPKTIKAISANVTVMLDDKSISRSAQRGDRERRMDGEL